ncbi:hypothetical protein [Phenylobacterium sp.]|uniref:hypothetical protein n=1 Tax=Phenylobacterium sp. TaxID=1871053 RepID=UPI003BAC8FFD
MSNRNRVLLLAAAACACALSGPASAAGYIKYGDVNGENAVAPQARPQAAGRAKADILIEGLGVLQAVAASRKAARESATRSAASEASQAPDIVTGAGAGGHPTALLVPAVQKARVQAPGE